MILLLRAIVRLVTFVLLVVLAVCGLAIAVFSIGLPAFALVSAVCVAISTRGLRPLGQAPVEAW